MKLKKLLIIMTILVIFLIIIDQLSKILVDNFVKDDKEIISNVIVVTKIENEGIAFGISKRKLKKYSFNSFSFNFNN